MTTDQALFQALFTSLSLSGMKTDKQDKDAVHWIASCTKFLTTIAVMQCVERGQLKLDDDISTILPEWKSPKILIGFDDKDEAQFRPAKRAITLR